MIKFDFFELKTTFNHLDDIFTYLSTYLHFIYVATIYESVFTNDSWLTMLHYVHVYIPTYIISYVICFMKTSNLGS